MDFFRSIGILYWSDLVEIIVCSMGIYLLSCWLAMDKQKKLLFYFYGYCGLLAGALVIPLPTIQYLLLCILPLLCTLIALIHQELLQKNFVILTRKTVHTPASMQHDWIQDIVRAALYAHHQQKKICYLLERATPLHDRIQTEWMIDAYITNWVLQTMIHHAQYDDMKFVWITAQGRLKAINSTLQGTVDSLWFSEPIALLPEVQQQVAYCTIKTDALGIYYEASTGTFTLLSHGTMLENIALQKMGAMLQHILKHEMNTNSDLLLYEHNKMHHKEL